jgi:pyruvate kinase
MDVTRLPVNDVQGFRIDLAWADEEWADQALTTLAEVSETLGKTPAVILDTSGPEIRVYNTAKACLRKENAVASPEGVKFEEGNDVMLCRGAHVAISSTEVPVDCSKTFTELAIEVGSVLHISSYLAAGMFTSPHSPGKCCLQRTLQ